jgi:hypothetical protein
MSGTSKLLAAALLAGLTLACGAVRAPARSPLAEPTATATTAATPPPVVTSTAAPRGDAPPLPTEVEPAAARATALLAEWLALPARDLAVTAAEAVVWPSSCLGVARPGEACADVRTPGFRVVARDGLGGLHTVHLAAEGGAARWVGTAQARGVLTSLDRSAQHASVTVEGRALTLRLAPGTLVGSGVRAGSEVAVGYDPAATASGVPVAAWLVPVP